MSEQQRIAEILQESEAIRRLRAETEGKTVSLVATIFEAIFGAPSEWKGKSKLGELVRIVGGGTPSRNVEHFYSGPIPWATSKDIKKLFLDDTEEHVSEQAVQSSATNVVPKGTVLVVVKSKILAHTLPVAITQVPMCFGQDIKGLIPAPGITPEFLVYSLQAQSGRILARARGANTEGLTLEALRTLDMPNPSPALVERFRMSCAEIRALSDAAILGNRIGGLTNASLSAHAFSGQLTAEWREANHEKLEAEARDRDQTLLASQGRIVHASTHAVATSKATASLASDDRNDGIYADLNREQRFLLRKIDQMVAEGGRGQYFTAERIADDVDGSLHRNPQGVMAHLQVFAARGLVIPVSRRRKDTSGSPFAGCFRLPLRASESRASSGVDYSDVTEQTGDDVRGELMKIQRNLATGTI